METFTKNYINPFPAIPPRPTVYNNTSYICDSKQQLKFNAYIGNKNINSVYLGNGQIISAYLGNKQIGTSITVVNDKIMVKLELPICNFLLDSVTTYNVGPVAHTTLNFLYYTVMIGKFYAQDVSPDKTQRNIKVEYSGTGSFNYSDTAVGRDIVTDDITPTGLTRNMVIYYAENYSLTYKTKNFAVKLSIEENYCLPTHIFYFKSLYNPPLFSVVAIKSSYNRVYVKTLAQLPYPYNKVNGSAITPAQNVKVSINADFNGYETIAIILPEYDLSKSFKMKYGHSPYTGGGNVPESHLIYSGEYSNYDFAFTFSNNQWVSSGTNQKKLYFKTQTYNGIPESVIYELTVNKVQVTKYISLTFINKVADKLIAPAGFTIRANNSSGELIWKDYQIDYGTTSKTIQVNTMPSSLWINFDPTDADLPKTTGGTFIIQYENLYESQRFFINNNGGSTGLVSGADIMKTINIDSDAVEQHILFEWNN